MRRLSWVDLTCSTPPIHSGYNNETHFSCISLRKYPIMWGTKLTSWVPRISWDAVLPSVQIVHLASQLSHNCIRSDGGLLSVPQCHNNRWSLCSESSKHRTQLPLEPFLHLVTSMKTVFEVLFDARFSVFLGHHTMTENWRNTLYFDLYLSWTPHRGRKLMYLFLGCHKILRLPSKCLKTTPTSCLLLSN